MGKLLRVYRNVKFLSPRKWYPAGSMTDIIRSCCPTQDHLTPWLKSGGQVRSWRVPWPSYRTQIMQVNFSSRFHANLECCKIHPNVSIPRVTQNISYLIDSHMVEPGTPSTGLTKDPREINWGIDCSSYSSSSSYAILSNNAFKQLLSGYPGVETHR
jgi:hypothetical protein